MSAGGPVRRRLSSLLIALYGWLASCAARRWVSVILIACILSVDVVLAWQGWGFTVRALLDEPCHQATGLICLGAITRFRGRPPDPRFGWAMLICSNLIDLDHLPLEFGSSALTAGTPRPYTHALWVVVVLGLAAVAARACVPARRDAGFRDRGACAVRRRVRGIRPLPERYRHRSDVAVVAGHQGPRRGSLLVVPHGYRCHRVGAGAGNPTAYP
jgi:hypothetical protein